MWRYFFFNDTATTEIYTSFPTRRSSDLRHLAAGDLPGRDLEDHAVHLAAPAGRPRPGPRGAAGGGQGRRRHPVAADRKSTRLNSSHANISYAVFCLKKKNDSIPSTTNSS